MNENYVEPIIINTDNIEPPTEGNSLYTSRKNIYKAYENEENSKVSIYILAYNRIEKTKRCVESVLKYSGNIDYELFLLDNGSEEETYNFFQSVKHDKKHIIKVTKNIGINLIMDKLYRVAKGKYIAGISNDVYVTKNWLDNILKCFESDEKIGWIVPMSSNVSNLQQVDLNFNSFEEMQEEAAKFNISNPLKWEERMRLVTPMHVMKREVFDLVGRADCGFFHDFGEDDWSLRIRRAGYKLILCGDTFVHHDHDFRNFEDKDQIAFQKSLEVGANNYREKYHGLDAWDDILNFERSLINMMPKIQNANGITPCILGINVKCGTPILEMKNHLKLEGVKAIVSSAFTTNAKYYEDLLTVTNNVKCDRLEYIDYYFSPKSFDYIILGESINMYNEPIRLIQKILDLLKEGGALLIKLRNTADISILLETLGNNDHYNGDMPIHISVDDICNCLKAMKVSNINISTENYNVNETTVNRIKEILYRTQVVNNVSENLYRLLVKEYLFCITK